MVMNVVEVNKETIITIKFKHSDMKKLLREIEKIGMLQRSNDINQELCTPILFDMYRKLLNEE